MLTAGSNILIEELEGDTLTPITLFLKMPGKKKFMLESSLKHDKSGRYSFIGANPVMELVGCDNLTTIKTKEKIEKKHALPLEVMKELIKPREDQASELFPFIGGAIGIAGYDVIRQYEQTGEILPDDIGLPDVHFMFFEEITVFDHLEQKVYLVATPITSKREELLARFAERKKEILQPAIYELADDVQINAFQAAIHKDDFIENVEAAKRYIEEGDIFQVVLSQRLSADFTGDPFSLYRKLRVQNPSPYLYYMDFEDYAVAGASPESLVKVTGRKVITNPIAGTRPRGETAETDEQLERELLADEKELAEHRMLLDLGRNDLGRVCEFGTVHIEKNMEIERYRHVMHIVSEVSGLLKEPYSALDALVACLPAGTVSGAPKIRAMEIINELEKVKRGLYSGAAGYISASGNMDFALAIRTIVLKDHKAYIQAGAGIVHDSVPVKEYEETLHKLKIYLEDQHDFIN